jgi:predicted aspartyl protease
MEARKQFFFEKKNQKTFAPMEYAVRQRVDQWIKVFASFSKKKRFLSSLALALSLTPSLAAAQCKISRAASMPLTMKHGRAFVPVSINETEGQFQIDTGAGETVLSDAFVRATHVGIDRHAGQYYMAGAGGRETLPAFHVHARHIEIGGISFQDWEFAATDMHMGADGLLGRDFLHYFDLELDMAAGRATLWRLFGCKDVQPPWKGDYDTIPLKKIGSVGALSLPIWIDNAFLNVMFDTGAGGLLLTQGAAERAGASAAQLASAQRVKGLGIGGGFETIPHKFGMLLVGSEVFNAPVIEVDPAATDADGARQYGGADGIVGLDLIRADRVWISFTTGNLFVQAPSKPRGK